MTRRDLAVEKYNLNRDAAVLSTPAPPPPTTGKTRGRGAKDGGGGPVKKKPKKASVANLEDAIAFNLWRQRIMAHLIKFMDSLECYKLLNELPPNYPPHKGTAPAPVGTRLVFPSRGK